MPHTITTPFVPSVHGFRFPNQFRNIVGPFSTYGRCNGMAWMALDFFHAGQPIPAITDVDFERPLESGLAAAITSTGVVQLFAWRHGGQRDLVGKTLRNRTFTNWDPCLRGTAEIAPAACCWGPNRTDVAIVGNDRQIWHASHDGPVLSDLGRDCFSRPLPRFGPLGGESDRQPAIAAPFPNRLEVYHIGLHDRALWFRYFEGDSWRGWNSQGRPLDRDITSGCAAASQHGFMAGYVRGADNAMWEKAWENGGWQPWRSVGGQFTSGPAAASPAPGRVELYGRGLDGAIWLAIRTGPDWSGWSSLGAPPGGARDEAPAAVARHGLLDLFVRGNDGKVWRRTWQSGGWLPWESVEAVISEEANRLAYATYTKTLTTTVTPVVLALVPLGLGLPLIGPARNYITWRTPSNEQTFRWTATDELRKLREILSSGRPIPLGLIAYGGGFGHEVVAFGLESDSNLPPGSFDPPGDFGYSIRVYDPNYPGCDNVRISFHGRDLNRRPINEDGPAIRSSMGDIWRGCFVRDDYGPSPPFM